MPTKQEKHKTVMGLLYTFASRTASDIGKVGFGKMINAYEKYQNSCYENKNEYKKIEMIHEYSGWLLTTMKIEKQEWDRDIKSNAK
tara:strand:- start:1255 stop:1512 length:258 start_codon:yes stop_codon:yes gene_type:complete